MDFIVGESNSLLQILGHIKNNDVPYLLTISFTIHPQT